METSKRGHELVEPICVVYDAVFSVPPFRWHAEESHRHRSQLLALLSNPSFGLATAFLAGKLVGFAYGFTIPADTGRWSRLQGEIEAETKREWPGRTFMLVDFAVLAEFRGYGIGRSLHDCLLRSRAEERATLTVQPTAVDTKRLYEHWGWRFIGQAEAGPDAPAPAFDWYLRDRLDDL